MLLTAALFFAAIAKINADTSIAGNGNTSSGSLSTSSSLTSSTRSTSTQIISTGSTSSLTSSSSTDDISSTSSSSTTSSTPSGLPSAITSSLNPTTTSGLNAAIIISNANSSTSSDLSPATTAAPYYNPAAFVNAYFFRMLASTGAEDQDHLLSCANTWASSFQIWLSTGKVTTGSIVTATIVTTTKAPWISSSDVSTETVYQLDPPSTYVTTIQTPVAIPPEVTTITNSGYGPLYYADTHLDFTAAEPCCVKCTIYGGNVQVYFWPPATETPAASTLFNRTQPPTISTLVDDTGFTFTSPSTYVAFQSMYAANLCGDVGPRFAATTLAFDPGELSTSVGYHITVASETTTIPFLVALGPDIVWTKAIFGDQTNCVDKLEVFYDIGGMAFTDGAAASSAASSLLMQFPMPGSQVSNLVSSFPFTYNPCSPTLSIPSQVLTLASEWSACDPPLTAFFDPPYTLSKGGKFSGFEPVTTSASPGPTPSPALPELTKITSSALAAVTPSQPDTGVPVANPVSSSASPAVPAASSIVEIPDPQTPTLSASEVNNPPATTPLANDPGTSNNSPPPAAVITLGSSSITAGQSSDFVFASQTLTPGGQVTVSGTQVSLASDGGFVVIGGSITQTVTTQAPSTIEYSVITVAGTVISILPGSTAALVGTKTVVLSDLIVPTTTSNGQIGWNIVTVGGFETGATPSVQGSGEGNNSYNGTVFTGGGAKLNHGSGVWSLALLLGLGLLGVCWL